MKVKDIFECNTISSSKVQSFLKTVKTLLTEKIRTKMLFLYEPFFRDIGIMKIYSKLYMIFAFRQHSMERIA